MEKTTYHIKKIAAIPGVCVVAVVAITMCKKPYNPTVINADGSILVVEGQINSGADSTFIRLSRSVKLEMKAAANPETRAVVTVEDDQNATYTLKEISDGNYAAAPLNLSSARKYRLRIKTTDSFVYVSDFAGIKNTPLIDSIGYKATDKGLEIYANTHDATNNTHYYRWSYDETWRFHTNYISNFETDGTQIVKRTHVVYECYANASSTAIVLGSSTKLSKDVIFEAPITRIDPGSEKISIRYTILVKQQALTKEEYEFWVNIQKNTETLGSIFDSQPSSAVGNLHCVTDPNLPVIGFVGVGNTQKKRIFIDKTELPATWKTQPAYTCKIDTVLYLNPKTNEREVSTRLIPLKSALIPLEQVTTALGDGFIASGRLCVDCTLRGTIQQPSFWK